MFRTEDTMHVLFHLQAQTRPTINVAHKRERGRYGEGGGCNQSNLLISKTKHAFYTFVIIFSLYYCALFCVLHFSYSVLYHNDIIKFSKLL